jgi:hypothetical protein
MKESKKTATNVSDKLFFRNLPVFLSPNLVHLRSRLRSDAERADNVLEVIERQSQIANDSSVYSLLMIEAYIQSEQVPPKKASVQEMAVWGRRRSRPYPPTVPTAWGKRGLIS